MSAIMGRLKKAVKKAAGKGSSSKQAILIREDLKLPKGKMAAQAAHASVGAVMEAEKEGRQDAVKQWRNEGMKKVVLRVKGIKELKRFKKLAEQKGIPSILITDAGRTVVSSGTITCMGLGPDDEEKIDEISGSLRIY